MDSNEISELKRLHFENVIWIVFAGLCILNILGDNDEIFYIERNDVSYKNEANTTSDGYIANTAEASAYQLGHYFAFGIFAISCLAIMLLLPI